MSAETMPEGLHEGTRPEPGERGAQARARVVAEPTRQVAAQPHREGRVA
ncbi:MAG: hypothetical protein ACRDMV_25440 [Streptosporangiales bacterium]